MYVSLGIKSRALYISALPLSCILHCVPFFPVLSVQGLSLWGLKPFTDVRGGLTRKRWPRSKAVLQASHVTSCALVEGSKGSRLGGSLEASAIMWRSSAGFFLP